MVPEVPAGAPFAFEMAVRSLDEQLERINALDTKAGVLIAADGVIVGLLACDRSVLTRAPAWIGVLVLATVGTSLILSLSPSPPVDTNLPRGRRPSSG